MKGISAVLATVLIVVITVAIIGMAYGWSTGMFKMVSDTSKDETAQQISNIEKAVSIIAATCVSGNSITGGVSTDPGTNPPKTNTIIFTIKNIGTSDILSGELTIFLNNNMLSDVITSNLANGASDEIRTLTTLVGAVNLKVSAPAGSVEKDIVCPPLV